MHLLMEKSELIQKQLQLILITCDGYHFIPLVKLSLLLQLRELSLAIFQNVYSAVALESITKMVFLSNERRTIITMLLITYNWCK